MRVTVILKDFTEQFYTGFRDFKGFLTMTDEEKFATCKRLHNEKRATMKIASGQFRDAVELNQLTRLPHSIDFKLEPRRGYKLAVFEFAKL